jgi:hypothetical protein
MRRVEPARRIAQSNFSPVAPPGFSGSPESSGGVTPQPKKTSDHKERNGHKVFSKKIHE